MTKHVVRPATSVRQAAALFGNICQATPLFESPVSSHLPNHLGVTGLPVKDVARFSGGGVG
jgi:hypothetical protein